MPDFAHRAILPTVALCAILLTPAFSPAADSPATRPAAPTFLGRAQGQLAIVDESDEPYFKLLQPLEMSAKTGRMITGRTIEAEQDECRRRYRDAVLDFTPAEMTAFDGLAMRISKAAEKSFPLFARTPWSFIKIRDGFEGGFPFTRARHIVLPQSFVAQVVRQQSDLVVQKQGWIPLVESASHLIACQLRVVQHGHRDAFSHMYQQLWHMVHVDKLEPGGFLTTHQYLTPGATDQRWVYQIKDDQHAQWILPLQILPGINPLGQKSAPLQAVALQLKGSPEQGFSAAETPSGAPLTDPISDLPQFSAQFAPSQDKAFNPDVAAADLFWKILVFEEMLTTPPAEAKDAISRAKPLLAQPREWFEKILAP